jgi:hypothetical protein
LLSSFLLELSSSCFSPEMVVLILASQPIEAASNYDA